ncbi:MAG: MFS transporter [Halobacteriales archaeon]
MTARTTPSGAALPWSAIAAIGGGLFGLGIAVGGYGAYVTALVEAGVEPDAAGFGMSLFLLGQLLVVVPADRLSRRLPVEWVTALGLGLGAVGIAIGGTLSLELTYAARLALGLGQGAAFVAGMKYVGVRTTGADVATAQGLLGALFTLGLAVGVAATPEVLAAVGPVGPAVAGATVTGLGAVATLGLTTVAGGDPVAVRRYLAPYVSGPGLALGLANMAAFGFLVVAATWYAEVIAGTVLSVTAVLAGFALSTFAGRAVGGWVSRVVGEAATVAGALFGLGAVLGGLALALAVDATLAIAAGLVLSGLGFGIPFGPLFSLAFAEFTDDPGVTLSGMLVVGNGGALAFPWLVGWLLARTEGYAAGFAAMAASVLVIWLVWLRAVGLRT